MRRDRIEMIQEILMLCRKPRRITEILRLANIQYNSFVGIIDPLVEKSFLIKVPCPKSGDKKTKYKWMTTAEGKALLGEIGEVLRRISLR